MPGDFEGKKVMINGVRAAEMFCKVESCTPHTSSFTWLFIRPPWALVGACCKECVFNNMKQYVAMVCFIVLFYFMAIDMLSAADLIALVSLKGKTWYHILSSL